MSYKLLSNPTDNPKVKKNIGQGVLTAPLHLAPYNLSGFQVCPMASQGCAAACLHTAGNPAFLANKNKGRIRKTLMFFNDRENFMNLLVKDIEKLRKIAKERSLLCGVRLNATSDISWEAIKCGTYKNIFSVFPDVMFMDYTKIVKRTFLKLPQNYRLVFSQSETNEKDCVKALKNGINVATVFGGKDLPQTWLNHKVIDGDLHDWRYGDYDTYLNEAVVVGLRAKGKARKDKSGFVKFV